MLTFTFLIRRFNPRSRMFLTTFPPTVDAIFGKDSTNGLVWLVSWKLFYAFWFFTMALVNLCPVWNVVGLFVKYGLVPNVSGRTTQRMQENLDTGGYYCLKSKDSNRVVAIRYGLFGPLVPTCAQTQG